MKLTNRLLTVSGSALAALALGMGTPAAAALDTSPQIAELTTSTNNGADSGESGCTPVEGKPGTPGETEQGAPGGSQPTPSVTSNPDQSSSFGGIDTGDGFISPDLGEGRPNCDPDGESSGAGGTASGDSKECESQGGESGEEGAGESGVPAVGAQPVQPEGGENRPNDCKSENETTPTPTPTADATN